MSQEYFVSFAIEENSIQAGLWIVNGKNADVICTSTSVNYEDDESLVRAGDECLSSCIQSIPEDAAEPSKTVFGIPSYWVTDGQISKNYLEKIKLLCNKLSLTPSGFVVLPEAIAHFQKSETNTPVSAIIIGIYSQSLDISLFRLGNLSGTVNVARSLNIVDDVVEGLVRHGGDNLPSQFIIYDAHSHDLEEVKQELIKADWNNLDPKIKFLHSPSVEIFKEDSKMAAVSLAAGVEMANLTGVNYKSSDHKKDLPVEETKTEIPDDVKNVSEGFVDPQSLGFTIGEDKVEPNPVENIKPKFRKFKLPSHKIGLPRNLKLKLSENAVFIGITALLILIIIGFVGFWFLPKADVAISVSPVKIDEKKAVTLDPKANSLDTSKLIIPVKEIATTESADKTKTTTGTKVIGTPAKGSVTFYNAGGETTIAAGTVLTASSQEFTLDADVQIASASGVASASSAKGNITASALGADGNLAGGTVFSVGNFSSSLIQAKNDSDLSGGTSQEVTAVSKDDITSLTTDLTTQLTKTGSDNLKQNLQPGFIFIDSSVKASVQDTSSDHQIGEQASTVKVTQSSKITGLEVATSDLVTLAKSLFKDKIPSGFSLKDEQIDYIFDGNNIEFKINLLPTIDSDKISGEIAGKNMTVARQILSKLPGYQGAQFQLKPDISFLEILPHVAKNISITLEAK